MLKKLLQRRLEHLAARYLKKHAPILVVVTGSVGKTSTKQAIATVLSEKFRVRAHDGNYNTHFSVPLAITGVVYPENVRSLSQWLAVFKAMQLRRSEPKDVDVIIQELGTDTPGDIAKFGRYLHPNIAVVTAVSDEHMEFFQTIEAVAKEELSVAAFSDLTIVNRDDIATRFADLADTKQIDTYGLVSPAEYCLEIEPASPLEGRIGRLHSPEWEELPVSLQLIGDQSLKTAAAAACVGAKLGLSSEQVAVGISKIKPVAGRMRLLRGLEESTIIDDTYNASPLAVEAALKTLYAVEAPQRIAILGSMNELGNHSPQAHEHVGTFCDPAKLDWVITIGADAEAYLAKAAATKGCQVKSFKSPYDAGAFVHKVMKPGAVILAKGSQNGVFAEEALKIILHSTEEETSLVRQSDQWLTVKRKQFSNDTVLVD